uniref:Putative secreted protein n=1 Tax=Anopheles darlingi TaxID=43151 RepID=A0A2M4DD98_ANODA
MGFRCVRTLARAPVCVCLFETATTTTTHEICRRVLFCCGAASPGGNWVDPLLVLRVRPRTFADRGVGRRPSFHGVAISSH